MLNYRPLSLPRHVEGVGIDLFDVASVFSMKWAGFSRAIKRHALIETKFVHRRLDSFDFVLPGMRFVKHEAIFSRVAGRSWIHGCIVA
jgi:hypothetical protein